MSKEGIKVPRTEAERSLRKLLNFPDEVNGELIKYIKMEQ